MRSPRLARIAAASLAWVASAAAAQPPPESSLDGTWTYAWYTDFQRPKDFKSLVATLEEAEAYEKPRRGLNGQLPSEEGELGQAESEFNDAGPGLARIRGEIRTSWIIDPANGRIPYADDVRERMGIGKPPVERYDNVEERSTYERCLTAAGAGAPLRNSPDTDLIQIVQTPGDVVIVSEKNHDARIVRMNAGPPAAWEPRDWLGVSVGRWQGKTLVVETTHRRAGLNRAASVLLSGGGKVTETFTRTGPDEITYTFTVEDYSLFTQPWRGEMVMRRSAGRMFEYACHEGNYSLRSILSAARQADAEAAKAAAAKPPGNKP